MHKLPLKFPRQLKLRKLLSGVNKKHRATCDEIDGKSQKLFDVSRASSTQLLQFHVFALLCCSITSFREHCSAAALLKIHIFNHSKSLISKKDSP
jgi:hypothetical protein